MALYEVGAIDYDSLANIIQEVGMFEGGRYKIPAGRFPTDRHDRRVITEDTSWDTFVSHSVTHFFAHFAETATVWGQGRRHFAETEIAGMGTGSGTFLCRQNSAGVEVSHMVSVSADPPVVSELAIARARRARSARSEGERGHRPRQRTGAAVPVTEVKRGPLRSPFPRSR